MLEVEVEDSGSYTVFRPIGELDASTASHFREAVGRVTSPRLLIDLSAVPFMDSAGLGALIGAIRRERETGGDVAVCCHRPTLTRLLRTAGFDRIITLAETIDEAAGALVRPAAS